ncbi:MAG: bifunctional serine/threonine-protein kinase/formylglycine-generating enzyme family protein [Thermoguttaceae bacterium]
MSYEPSDAKKLFLQAVELTSPEDRSAFLDRACGGNAELRTRVDQLLQSHESPGSFLEQPALADLAGAIHEDGPSDYCADGSRSGPTGDSPSSMASVPLDFLQPCSTPGRIGKLGVYEIIEVLGQGGMGIVLKGYDTKLQRVVAIKSLTPALASNATAVKRFLREARAAAAVSHDHVVTIFAVEEGSAPPYLVMECIAGQSLQQKIDRRGPLDPAEILRIGMQIADGLAAAHKQGLIHRDIKPSNILLENGVERVKITDFGLARAVDDVTMTQSGHVTGTPEYMSPEQAKGDHLDGRSDLFSLGSVLYTMCTGRPAFRAESAVAVLRRVCDDAPRPILQINPAIPDVLIAVIDKLMAKQPRDRFQSVAEVSELLSAALAWLQQPDGRTPPQVPRLENRKGRWRRRAVRFLIFSAIAVFVAWASLLPTFRLLLSNEAQILFYIKDGDATIELFRDGELVATHVGYGRINVPAGTYKFRVRKKPGIQVYNFVFEQWTWWLHRDLITLASPPQALPISRGDQLTVSVAFVVDLGDTETPTDDSTLNGGPVPATVPFDEQQAQAYQEECAQRLGVPVNFQGPLGIDFRLIPPGTFEMGNSPEEVNGLLRELELNGAGEFEKFAAQSTAPRHKVRLNQPFYLASHEVTVAQFRRFVEETGYLSTLEAVESPPFTWKSLLVDDDPDQRPLIGVSWEDANAFCRWLGKQDQIDYELPTEAQWEFACRAGSAGRWSFGDDTIDLSKYAICEQAVDSSPTPVGGKRPNAFGLFDMHGNADEWCLDWHKTDFYGRSPTDDPVCLESATDPASGRVVRGGAWNSAASWTRSASRSYDFSGLPVRFHGFRIAIVGDLKTIPVVTASISD